MKVLRTLTITLQVVDEVLTPLSTVQCMSKWLSWVVCTEGGISPGTRFQLRYLFEGTLDVKGAESGYIIPVLGAAPDYDERKRKLQNAEDKLDTMFKAWFSICTILASQCCTASVSILSSGIEGRVPKEFKLVSQMNALRLFCTYALRELIMKHMGATEAAGS